MYKKIFVLLIVLILAVSIYLLVRYDKKVLENRAKNELIIESEEDSNEEIIEESEETDLGYLIIDKIGLNGQVKEGSSNAVLKEYIGHIEETAKYDGNVALAAHNRGNEHSYFARLNELVEGDQVVYKTKYGERTYKVTNKQEILETDWSLLANTSENRLTLITCIKNKVNQRLCVQAVQI